MKRSINSTSAHALFSSSSHPTPLLPRTNSYSSYIRLTCARSAPVCQESSMRILTYRIRFPTVFVVRTGRSGNLFLREVQRVVNAFDLSPFPLTYVAGSAIRRSRMWLVSGILKDVGALSRMSSAGSSSTSLAMGVPAGDTILCQHFQ